MRASTSSSSSRASRSSSISANGRAASAKLRSLAARPSAVARAQCLSAAASVTHQARTSAPKPATAIRAVVNNNKNNNNNNSAAQSPRRRAAVRANAASAATSAADAAGPPAPPLPAGSVSVILLSGGSGKRMGAPIPKQYLELRGRAIATHSMATFSSMPEVGEIVVVCDPAWRPVFEPLAAELKLRGKRFCWALPGAERQDSVASGLAQVSAGSGLVAVHDSARPLVAAEDAARCMRDGWLVGAAVLGVPCKQTVKEVHAGTGLVARTLDRSLLWEVQTPQCVRPDLLRRGFERVARDGLAVTDDVSVVEALGEPVRVTRGCYTNIKVTTPEDMGVAEGFIDEREAREKKGQQQQEGAKAAPAAAAAAAAAA